MLSSVLFDLDGTLADFVGGAAKRHGKKFTMADVTAWDFISGWGFDGVHDPRFWDPLSNFEFWEGLQPLRDGMRLFRAIADSVPRENIGFLTSGDVAGCVDGKLAWIKKHLPGWEKHAFVGSAKFFFGAGGNVLVDDYDGHAAAFTARGGKFVTVPRPWNSLKNEACPRGSFNVDAVYARVMDAISG